MTERWSLAAGYVPDGWATALVLACAMVAVVEGMVAFRRRDAGIGRRTRITIGALRLIGIAALLSMAFELTLRIDSLGPAGRRVVVLVDRSASMDIADAAKLEQEATRRQDRARALWRASEGAPERWAADGLQPVLVLGESAKGSSDQRGEGAADQREELGVVAETNGHRSVADVPRRHAPSRPGIATSVHALRDLGEP